MSRVYTGNGDDLSQANKKFATYDRDITELDTRVTESEQKIKDISTTTYKVMIPVAAWSEEYPFSNIVQVEGITAADKAIVIGLYVPTDAAQEDVENWSRAIGCLMMNDSESAVTDNSITFLAYKKPQVDFTVMIEAKKE